MTGEHPLAGREKPAPIWSGQTKEVFPNIPHDKSGPDLLFMKIKKRYRISYRNPYTGKEFTIPKGWFKLPRGHLIKQGDLILYATGFTPAVLKNVLVSEGFYIRKKGL